MTPNPQSRRPTLIPVAFDDDDDVQPSHRAATIIEGYEPPKLPQPAQSAPVEPPRRVQSPAPRGFLGLGPLADALFLLVLSVIFAAGLGIGAALVVP